MRCQVWSKFPSVVANMLISYWIPPLQSQCYLVLCPPSRKPERGKRAAGWTEHEIRYKGINIIKNLLAWLLVRGINSVNRNFGSLELKRAAGFVTSNHREPSSWQHYFCLALWHSCLISTIPSDNGDSNIKRHNRYICILPSVQSSLFRAYWFGAVLLSLPFFPHLVHFAFSLSL